MQVSEEQQNVIDNIRRNANVIVDACAGSGKSTTILSTALAMPERRFLQITYNSSLRKEIKEKVKQLEIKNVAVHTYHSLAVAKFLKSAHTDSGIRKILYEKLPPSSVILTQDVIVLDESQDMTHLYFQFIVYYLHHMCKSSPEHRVQIMVLGDYMQGLYEFKGSDIRFLTCAEEIWCKCPFLINQNFVHCSLKTSYRITKPMASFVNTVMLGEERLCAVKDGEPVYYIRNSTWNLQRIVVHYIRDLIQNGANPSDFFVLGGSVKGPNSAIRKIENALSEANIPCHVPMFEDGKIDEKVMEGKVVFSTFHCVKGRQRPYVFLVGFDQSYMTYFGRTLDTSVCPNTLYVGATRATHKMFLLESDQNAHDRPLEFLKMTHTEMRSQPYVDFKGTPRTVFYQRVKENDDGKIRHQTTPTDLIKFIPEEILEALIPILDKIFTNMDAPFEQTSLDIPSVVQPDSSKNAFEDVSDLNGIAISSMFYDYLAASWNETADDSETYPDNILYDIIQNSIAMMHSNEHAYLKQVFRELSSECDSIEDYLYMANIFVATQEKLYFKLKQIPRTAYNWLNTGILSECKKRIMAVLGEETSRSRPSMENTIIQKMSEEDHSNIDHLLSKTFPDRLFRFTARIDLETDVAVWELKCCSTITHEHMLQVVIYAWLMRTLEPNFEKPFKIFNIRTGEIRLLECDKTVLDDIVISLLRGKYEDCEKKPDADFVESCVKVFTDYNNTTN